MGKWSQASKRNLSEAMKRRWARIRRQKQYALSHKEHQLTHTMQDNVKEFLQETSEDHEFPHVDGVLPERFPFREYGDVVREARKIILDRDSKGRNAYATFYDGFPHGLSDATFETHRRVTRVLGLERQLANGIEDKKPLQETMRQDLIDLINYSVFAVLLLDKEVSK